MCGTENHDDGPLCMGSVLSRYHAIVVTDNRDAKVIEEINLYKRVSHPRQPQSKTRLISSCYHQYQRTASKLPNMKSLSVAYVLAAVSLVSHTP